ncbi:MAG: hypothetical protein JEZ07_00540 [Phycisphaerae bacterium]|nr:hypothetical protein [Phycisphaerae bacterium]
MENCWTVLKILGFTLALGWPILHFIIAGKFLRDIKKIPEKSSEELREIIQKNKMKCNSVLKELAKRGHDIEFALPVLLELACEKNRVLQLAGWAGLKTYFSDRFAEIDFSKHKPTAQDKEFMFAELQKYD